MSLYDKFYLNSIQTIQPDEVPLLSWFVDQGLPVPSYGEIPLLFVCYSSAVFHGQSSMARGLAYYTHGIPIATSSRKVFEYGRGIGLRTICGMDFCGCSELFGHIDQN